MRPSADIRPPGIYPAMAEPTIAPLTVADTKVAGFVGIAQKGPIDEARRITSWDEFAEIYGYDPASYLSDSVEAYFRNGGQVCHVVRVAHLPRDGAEPSLDHATCAELVLLDDWNKPCLRVRARSEGRWGNHIWVSARHATGATALLTQDLDLGVGRAQLSTTRGFKVGALVRIHCREVVDHVILTEVAERAIGWGAETPLNHAYKAAGPTHLEVVELELHVALRDRREVWKGLQMHRSSKAYAPRVIEAESRLIRLEDLDGGSPPPHNLPEPLSPVRLAAGRDGVEAITPEDFVGTDRGPGHRSGLMALAAVDEVATLACPDALRFVETVPGPEGELKSQWIQDVMVDQCELLKDRFAVLDCPRTRSIDLVKRWRRRIDSTFAAFYWPWVGVPAPDGTVHRIPPSGIMAGIFAQRDREGGVFLAPANVPVAGAIDLSVAVTEDDLGALNAEGVNVLRAHRGIRPWGARTASSEPAWRYVNVRRLFIMLRRSIEAGMGWVPFESNDHKTWDRLKDLVRLFLEDLYQKGAFAGGKSEDAYYVKCDDESNPPEAVARGILTCEIGVAPAVPAEFLMIQLVQNVGGE
jgi:uncharacterized protein